MLYDDLEGCDWGGREIQEVRDIHVHTANSFHCTAETREAL